MGNSHNNNGRGHNRRHTVANAISQTSITPYTKHIPDQSRASVIPTKQQINNNNNNNKNNNNSHPIGMNHSVDYIPNKLIRSVSTPTLSNDQLLNLNKATIDLAPSTPKQHLIKSYNSNPFAIKPSQKKSSKIMKNSKNNLFHFNTTTKTKMKSMHNRFQSAIPYVNFNDDKFNKKKNFKKRQKKSKSAKKFIMRNAFSSNDEHSASSHNSMNESYHSDPQTILTTKQRRRKSKFNKNRYNSHHKNGLNGKKNGKTYLNDLYSSNHNQITHRHSYHHHHHHRHHKNGSALNDEDELQNQNRRKILLLGNGSCGKSTIFKQLKLILGTTQTFDENELAEATHAIRQNCVSVLLTILHKSAVLYEEDSSYFSECHIDDNNEEITTAINYVMKYKSESFEKIDQDLSQLSKYIHFLWNLDAVQTTLKFRHKRFTVPDNMHYFYNETDAIFSSSYCPSHDDILRLRIRTTGMIESSYTILDDSVNDKISEYKISIFDTGGERNERKKWIHTFENVDVVIFVAALSHFCCVLWEDEKTISMHDAIELFQEICNGKWFKRSEMILCLNKNDLFRQLLYDEITLNVGFAENVRNEGYSIKTHHPDITPPPSPNAVSFEFGDFFSNQDTKKNDNDDNKEEKNDNKSSSNNNRFKNLNQWTGKKWTGPNFKYDAKKTVEENNIYFEKCYDKAVEYIVQLFLSQNKDPNKTPYVHITNAIDQTSINDTFDEIRPLIINSNYAGHCKQFF